MDNNDPIYVSNLAFIWIIIIQMVSFFKKEMRSVSFFYKG